MIDRHVCQLLFLLICLLSSLLHILFIVVTTINKLICKLMLKNLNDNTDLKSVIMCSCVRHTLLLTLRFIWATLWWMKHHVDIHVIDWSVCSLEAYWLIQEGPLHSLRSYGMINNLESYLMKKHFYLTIKLRHHEQRFLILNWFVLLK